MNIKLNAVQVAISTILVGLISYLIPSVGARLIEPMELATLLSIWAVVNTLIITLNSPLDLLLPKISQAFTNSQKNQAELTQVTLIFGLLSGLFSGALLIIFSFISKHESDNLILALFFYCIALGIFSSLRTLVTALGRFGNLLYFTFFYALFGIIALALNYEFKIKSTTLLIISLTLSTIAACVLLLIILKIFKFSELNEISIRLKNFFYDSHFKKNYTLILLMTLFMLVMNNGIVIGANEIGITAKNIVLIAAISSFIRIPLLILNSASPPILNAAAYHEKISDFYNVKKLYVKSMFMFTSVIFATSLLTYYFSNQFIYFYLGENYIPNKWIAGQVIAAECLIALVGIPRIFLVTLHLEKTLLKIVSVAVSLFVLVATFDLFDGLLSLTLGIILASTFIIIASHFLFVRNINVKIRD